MLDRFQPFFSFFFSFVSSALSLCFLCPCYDILFVVDFYVCYNLMCRIAVKNLPILGKVDQCG